MEKELILCCRKGDLERVKQLVEERDVEVNYRDKYDSTPLYYACLCGHMEVVQYLLLQGARCDANTFDGERCIYGALTTDIRNILRRHKIVSAQTVRRELYHEFLRRLLDTGEYSDVTFVVHGRKLMAHKCVLIARSEFFAEKFVGRWVNRDEVSINKSLVNPDAFRAILYYLYTGQLTIQVTQVDDVLRLAKHCRLSSLHRRLTEMTERAQCFQNSKPGMRVTTVSVDPPLGSDELNTDLAALADEALPTEFRQWIAASVLPILDEPPPLPMESAIGQFYDVVFTLDGHEYKCHQAFFGGRSEFFRALISDPLGEQRNSISEDFTDVQIPVVPLRHFTPPIFVYILYYVYQDYVELDTSVVYDVLVAADMCLLPGLKRQCGNYIASLLDSANVFPALRAARLFNLARLEDSCYIYLAENIEQIIEDTDFHAFIAEDANSVSSRQDVDSIDIIDQIRYHLTAETIDDAQERLSLIDELLERLGYDA